MEGRLLSLMVRPCDPRVILRRDAAYFSVGQVKQMCARWTDGYPAMLERPGMQWSVLEGEAVCRARDVLWALDMGLLTKAAGMTYKIFEVRDLADLDALPLRHDRDGVSAVTGPRTLEDDFRDACHVISTVGVLCNSAGPVSGLSDAVRAAAWAGQRRRSAPGPGFYA